ncbi:MAG: Rne/Rng family ribonuclease [Cyanobacteria bacterium]|nr:Rne/Rng family ribonuclease [Cyanobacteriota bacterium]
MRQLVISEQDNVAALMDNGKAIDFIIQKNDFSVGDVYAVTVENIMQSINAVFVKLQDGQMGFLHANDIPGRGLLYDRLSPGQRLLVQIVKEPTGNKGPRVNLAISIPGRYYVLTSENKSIAISRRISENTERDRLRSITNLMKPEELGVVIRTEAAGHSQEELEEDFLTIWEKWKNIVDKYDRLDGYGAIYKESDFLYTTLRDHYNTSVDEIVVGGMQAKYKCQEHLKGWTGREVNLTHYDADQVLIKTDVVKELRNCLSNRVNLPSGGYLVIQGMEALTAIDINSGKFTSSNTLRETVRRTNMEAAVEIARQMRLRNIGGMIIIDFIDMSERADRITVMEVLENALRPDKAKPQVGQLSDLCLVEITRKRSGQALAETFGNTCQHCSGTGVIFNLNTDDSQHNHGNRRPRNSNQRSYNNRPERNDRSERPERNDRSERPERNDRSEPSDRNDSSERSDRGEQAANNNDRRNSGRNYNQKSSRYNNRDQRGGQRNRGPRPTTDTKEDSPGTTTANPAQGSPEAAVMAEKQVPKEAPETKSPAVISSSVDRSKTKSFGATHIVENTSSAMPKSSGDEAKT